MGNLGKAIVCAGYRYSGIMNLQEALTAWRGRSCATILLFHRVTDEVPEDGLTVGVARFRRVCRLLRRRFRVVTVGEAVEAVRSGRPVPQRTIAITFDDCYRNNLPAARVLAEHGLPACFFIPSGFVGTDRAFDWDGGFAPLANLTWDEVHELCRMGFEIGAHTVNHVNLAKVPEAVARREIIESKRRIEMEIGRPVRWFAYPFGGPNDFPAAGNDFIREAGLDACFSGHGGRLSQGDAREILPRQPAPTFQSMAHWELYLTGCLDWYYLAKRRAGRPEPLGEHAGALLHRAQDAARNDVHLSRVGDCSPSPLPQLLQRT